MSQSSDDNTGLAGVLEGQDVDEVLRDSFYQTSPAQLAPPRPTRRARRQKVPDHYKVICISLYREDLERLDEMVSEAKGRGHRKMSRSALIRYALDHVDLDAIPKSY